MARFMMMNICLLAGALLPALAAYALMMDENLVNEFRKEKANEGTAILADADWIAGRLVALRQQQQQQGQQTTPAEAIHQLAYEKPFNQLDVPFVMTELVQRAQLDPEFRGWFSTENQLTPQQQNQLIRRYIVDSCKYFIYLFDDFFKRAETSDPQMRAYASDPTKSDFYHDFGTYKVCNSLLAWIEQI